MRPAHTFEITQHARSVNSFTQYMKMQSYLPWLEISFQAFMSVEYVNVIVANDNWKHIKEI